MISLQLALVYLVIVAVVVGGARAWQAPEPTRRRRTLRRLRVAALFIAFIGVSLPAWWLLFPFGIRSCDMEARVRAVQRRPFAYDRAGRPLGPIDERVGRYIPIDSLRLGVALVFAAAEDRRMFDHDGVDARGIFRAVVRDVLNGRREGASTIHMQAVRTLCGGVMPRDHTLTGKFSEMGAAIRLADAMQPARVLELYVNTAFLGRNRWGIDAAARTYYGLRAEDLLVAEAAQLAAMLRSPARLDPSTLGQDLARRDRRRVLRIAAAKFPNHSAIFRSAENDRTRDVERDPRMEASVAGYINAVANVGDIAHLGDTVITGISLDLQRAAEHAIRQLIADIESGRWGRSKPETGNELQSVYVAMDAVTGELLAYLPSRPDAPVSFDRIRHGAILWSSTAKPVLYGVDIDAGRVLPGDRIADLIRRTNLDVRNPWFRGIRRNCYVERTLEAGIAHSDNCMAIALLRMMTTADVERLRVLGVEVANPASPVEALGIRAVSPLTILRAYGAVANQGLLTQPRFLVDPKHGATPDTTRLWSPETARLVAASLVTVVTSGTAKGIRDRLPYAWDVFGKTGTADDGTEFLFVGASGRVVSLLWLGHDRRRAIVPNGAAGDVVVATWADIISQHALSIGSGHNAQRGSAW